MSMDASMHQFSLHRFMLAKVKFPDLSIAGQRRLASRRSRCSEKQKDHEAREAKDGSKRERNAGLVRQ